MYENFSFEVWNCMESMEYMYGTFVWNSCKESMDLLVRKPSSLSLCLCLG